MGSEGLTPMTIYVIAALAVLVSLAFKWPKGNKWLIFKVVLLIAIVVSIAAQLSGMEALDVLGVVWNVIQTCLRILGYIVILLGNLFVFLGGGGWKGVPW